MTVSGSDRAGDVAGDVTGAGAAAEAGIAPGGMPGDGAQTVTGTGVAGVLVGQVVTAGPQSTGYPEWNRFAAVNDEFVPIHMDDEEGRRAGYPRAIAMGRLHWSYAHRMLREWQPEGRVLALSLQFRRPSLRDVPFEVKAQISAVREESDRHLIEVELWIEDADGMVLAPGSATVAVPRCAEA